LPGIAAGALQALVGTCCCRAEASLFWPVKRGGGGRGEREFTIEFLHPQSEKWL